MQIERKRLSLIQDISYGDTFKQNGTIYMKIYNKDKTDKSTYGVNLENGEFYEFSNFSRVERITLNVSEE